MTLPDEREGGRRALYTPDMLAERPAFYTPDLRRAG
jgi:hypothetical protein